MPMLERALCRRFPHRPPHAARTAALALLLAAGAAAAAGAAVPEPWTSTGPDIGWVTALLRPQRDFGPLLAGTFGGGVFRSDDDGLTWQPAGTGLQGRFVNALAADTRPLPYVFVGTSDAGIWRAASPINAWEDISRGSLGNYAAAITGIAVDPSDYRNVLLSTDPLGMFTSRSAGNTWPDSLRWLGGFTMLDAEIPRLASNIHYGLEPYGVWWTANRGQTLHGLFDGLPGVLMEDLALWPTNLDTLVAATYGNGIYVMRNATQAAPIWSYAGLVPETQAHPLTRTLAITPTTSTILAGSELGVHASSDLGTTWQQLDDGLGLSHPEVWAILVEAEAPLTLALGTYTRGFLRSAPGGGAWVPQNTGLRAGWVRGLHAWGDSLLAGTAHGRLYLSPDAGQSWSDRTGSIDELDLFGLLRLSSGRWLVGGNTRVWASDDRGLSWHVAGAGLAVGQPAFQLVQPSWLDAGVVVAATSRGVYRSDDGGESFAPVAGLPNPNAPYLTLAAVPGDSSLWAGAYGDDLYRSAKGGLFVAQSLRPGGTSTYRALVFPTGTSEVVVVGTEGALFRYDAGVPHDIGGGLPSRDVAALLYLDATSDLYVGLDGDGVFRSPDTGGHWQALSAGLGSGIIEALAATTGALPRVHAATLGASVRSRPADDAVPVFFDGPRLTRTSDGVQVAFHWTALSRASAVAHDGSSAATTAAWSAVYRAVEDGPWIEIAEQAGDGDVVVLDRLEGIDPQPGRWLRYRVDLAEGAQVIASSIAELVLEGDGPALRTRLLPNVPNPFNPRTDARFQLAHEGPVTLEVLDARGRRVALLLRQVLPAGQHRVTWQGIDDRGHALSSGAYVLRLVADGRIQTRVITMLR